MWCFGSPLRVLAQSISPLSKHGGQVCPLEYAYRFCCLGHSQRSLESLHWRHIGLAWNSAHSATGPLDRYSTGIFQDSLFTTALCTFVSEKYALKSACRMMIKCLFEKVGENKRSGGRHTGAWGVNESRGDAYLSLFGPADEASSANPSNGLLIRISCWCLLHPVALGHVVCGWE